VYLDSTEATGSQPHVTEGQSDGEGVTMLNHEVTDLLRMRLRRRRHDEEGAKKTVRSRWRDEDSANGDGVTETAWRRRRDGDNAAEAAATEATT